MKEPNECQCGIPRAWREGKKGGGVRVANGRRSTQQRLVGSFAPHPRGEKTIRREGGRITSDEVEREEY